MILDLFKSKSEPITAFPRCQHRSPAGRQCSQPICSTSPQFCFSHKPKPEELLIAELTEAAGSLSTPEEINRFLTRVTLLRIQDRLTPKEACGYAYLCQILQRGQREIAFHQKLKDERAQRAAEQAEEDEVMSWSIPRPDRSDDPVCPESQGAESSESLTSSTSLTSSASSPPPASPVPTQGSPESAPSGAKSSESSTSSPLPPEFYNHFYPIDPTLPPGLQNPAKNIPPPDEAECHRLAARRGLLFNRRRPSSSGILR